MHFWASVISFFDRNPLKTCDATRPHVSATHISCPVRKDQHCKFVCDQTLTLLLEAKGEVKVKSYVLLSYLVSWANHNYLVLDFSEALLSLMRKKRLSSSSVCTEPHAASALASILTAQTVSCSTAENSQSFLWETWQPLGTSSRSTLLPACSQAASPESPDSPSLLSLGTVTLPSPWALTWGCSPCGSTVAQWALGQSLQGSNVWMGSVCAELLIHLCVQSQYPQAEANQKLRVACEDWMVTF